MPGFLQLLRKDLETIRWPLGLFSGLTVAFAVFTRLRIASGAFPIVAAAFAPLIPLMFLPFWLLWQGFQSLRSEWREDTVYTLLALPIPGWQITLSKLLVIWAEYTLLLVVILGSNLLLFSQIYKANLTDLPAAPWLLRNGLLAYVASLAVLGGVVSFIHLAFVVAKLVGRVQGLVALWVLILTTWLVQTLGTFLESIFRWIPPVPLHLLLRLDEIRPGITLYWKPAQQVAVWLGVLAVFFASAYLLEHHVEIHE